MKTHAPQKKNGFVLVEALIASAILALVLAAGIGAFLLTMRTGLGNAAEVQSAFLAEEGLEALRIMRDNGWSTNISPLTASSTYYLVFDGTTWDATTTNSFIDDTFERSIVLFEVSRDSNETIVTSGGTEDPDTRLAVVSVSWREGDATTTRSLSAYMSNVFSN
ncbi:type II secretion system protein [Candidatus Parcubacteria bacterium]|nr:MAG: type II secretion system protein [Candidatus Parcubacteria bacterium]